MIRFTGPRLATVLSGLALIIANLPSAHADLATAIAREMSGQRATITPEVKAAVAARHFVFVGGYLGEFGINYFKDNRSELKEKFGAKSDIIRIKSEASIEENADLVYDRLIDLYHKGGDVPLVVIGHSYGGATAAYIALRDRNLVWLNVVDKFVTISGAIGGSRIASLFSSDCNGNPNVPPIPGRPVTVNCFFTGRGLQQLRPESMRASFSPLLAELTQGDVRLLEKRLYYVRSSAKSIDGRRDLPTDLLVDLDYQKLNGVGTDLGVIKNSGHGDMVLSFLSRYGSDYRRAVTRALALELYGSEGR